VKRVRQDRIRALLPWAEELKTTRERMVEFRIPRDKLRETIETLKRSYGVLHVSMITGTDFRDRFELTYFIWLHGPKRYIVIRTSCPRDSPEVDTISDIIPGAHVYENEIYDLLGVEFNGNDRLVRPFLKPETMRPDEFPLRKDWQGGSQS